LKERRKREGYQAIRDIADIEFKINMGNKNMTDNIEQINIFVNKYN